MEMILIFPTASKIPIDLYELPYDVEDAVPRSSQNIIIDLNAEDSPEIGYPIIELDLNQFFEDDDEARSDSSVEEDIDQQANGGEGNNVQEIFNEFDDVNGQAVETRQGNVQGRKKKTLTNAERWAVYHALLEKSGLMDSDKDNGQDGIEAVLEFDLRKRVYTEDGEDKGKNGEE
ncbi:BAH domain [Striga asiatica]|uniref:BAH domain n=1 Tax=Striga asiatica TaxID=4170 RepID=A0A5A7Q2W6_STRAF|nr:BAH domain [Striga asiatica]